ncbi:prolyl oligopeptidase family serine peptidase [Nocardioides sp. zg-579]|uniref:Prolyl oligopeptidase family serine peptidase n=1 Tax=Nocardioides marmotae TaxID=2663857 RepID=A0A6I3JFK1_9ACTN|nr:prolyl oligopeptidase family serine peptidase [Gordonia jinghuaiqii]MTB96897.1 prolyl oligopeptidase family serine peptidase [Nocardioides marmotae]QKE02916.1 prolyl oligopeptidase family serine peptidase [Nocardioides marmotae]
MRASRRGLLGGVGLGIGSLAGCGEDPPATTTRRSEGVTGAPAKRRIEYGDDPAQLGELHLPAGDPRGVVVVVHGGFWRAQYDLSLGTPLAVDLARRGWAAWNIEYRRVGAGGGAPETFDDVAAAIDALRGTDLDLSTVVAVGHSAGGHLAAWAASRTRDERWAGGVELTGVVSQAGVLDLRRAVREGVGETAVPDLLGVSAPAAVEAAYDPQQQLPLDVPLWCVHGREDDIVPINQSEEYVAAATAAGATAELVAVEGDHFVVIDPAGEAWTRTVAILDTLA